MSKQQTFYKTVFTIEVLSDEPLDDPMSLDDIHYAITDGNCSGSFGETIVTEFTREQVAAELIAQGSDPDFLLGTWEDDE